MPKDSLYPNTAFLYDFDNRELLNYDVVLCIKYLKETDGDILEIACGTGRVSIPVVKCTDRSILAFDLSDEMLAVFRSKITGNEFPNLQIKKADMTAFDFDRKFGYIILVWRAFQSLTKDDDIKSCLKCIRDHMDKDSVMLFSVFIPQDKYGPDWVGKEALSYDLTDPVSGNRIKRYSRNIRSDEKNQIIEYASIYEVTQHRADETTTKTEVFEDRIIYRYYYPPQIKQLLTDNGFSVINEYTNETDIFLEVKKG